MADSASVPPPQLSTGGAQSSNRGVMIVLSYLWPLALVPLLVEKDDKEVQWHARHGIVLMLAEIVFWIAITIVQMALGTILGCVVGLLSFSAWIGIVVLHILAIVKGVNGSRLTVPGVSQYADTLAGAPEPASPTTPSASLSTADQALRIFEDGRRMFAAGQVREGLSKFTEALRIDPTCVEANLALARAFFTIDPVTHADLILGAGPCQRL